MIADHRKIIFRNIANFIRHKQITINTWNAEPNIDLIISSASPTIFLNLNEPVSHDFRCHFSVATRPLSLQLKSYSAHKLNVNSIYYKFVHFLNNFWILEWMQQTSYLQLVFLLRRTFRSIQAIRIFRDQHSNNNYLRKAS